jgi:hypothetical protein
MLLRKIEHHLKVTNTTPAGFGRACLGDPKFVFDLRNGREPRACTASRVLTFMSEVEAGRDDL